MKPLSAPRRYPKLSKPMIGLVLIATLIGAIVTAVSKNHIITALRSGETRTVRFAGDYFLLERSSNVKVAGVDAGVVKSVEEASDGSAVVEVKITDEVVDRVGSAPSARLRPTTLLGGVFYIDILPGGDRTQPWKDDIPLRRTQLPVEVGSVIQQFQPDAVKGTSSAIRQFDATLGRDGSAAVRDLLDAAPDTLEPGARVLEAMRGDRPRVDLPDFVGGLQRTSAVLTRQEDELTSILSGLREVSGVLAETSKPMATAIDRMPATLVSTDAGLRALNGTLDRLEQTAGPARPAVQRLTALLAALDPMLANARPVITDLRQGLERTRPFVEELVPVADRGKSALGDLRGPVLDRVNGPFKDTVMSPFDGTGVYEHTAGDSPFYRELGFMLSNLNQSGSYVDDNGHAVGFQPGPGPGTLAGPASLEKLFQDMFFPGGLHE